MLVSSVLVSCNDQVQTSDISHSYLNSTDWPEDVKREYALQVMIMMDLGVKDTLKCQKR